jgi:hypothetical protein
LPRTIVRAPKKLHCLGVGGYDLAHLAQRINSLVQFSDLFRMHASPQRRPISVASGVFRALMTGVVSAFFQHCTMGHANIQCHDWQTRVALLAITRDMEAR